LARLKLLYFHYNICQGSDLHWLKRIRVRPGPGFGSCPMQNSYQPFTAKFFLLLQYMHSTVISLKIRKMCFCLSEVTVHIKKIINTSNFGFSGSDLDRLVLATDGLDSYLYLYPLYAGQQFTEFLANHYWWVIFQLTIRDSVHHRNRMHSRLLLTLLCFPVRTASAIFNS
jgi:hypothetical protein